MAERKRFDAAWNEWSKNRLVSARGICDDWSQPPDQEDK